MREKKGKKRKQEVMDELFKSLIVQDPGQARGPAQRLGAPRPTLPSARPGSGPGHRHGFDPTAS